MFKFLVTAAVATVVLATSALANPGFVTRDLNVRSGPGTDYHVIAQVPACGKIHVYDQAYGWYLVTYRGYEGWVSARYVSDSYACHKPVYHPPVKKVYKKTYRPSHSYGY